MTLSPTLLKIKATVDRLDKFYADDPRTKTFNCIVFGPPKIGKSELIKTMPGPILVHSFDPGGTKVLEDEIATGRVIVDTRFEVDDPKNPKAYDLWQREMEGLIKDKFFDHVGTLVLDSMTTWAQTIMYRVIQKAAGNSSKRVTGGPPQQNDYVPQMNEIENWMRKFAGLPCNCVLLGHDDLPTNEDGTPIDDRRLMITGKLSKRVPALFDEVYYMHMPSSVKGERKLQTQPKNRVAAGSRLGRGGRLELFEEPDIKAILKKVGYPHEDKPLFHELFKSEE